MAPGVRERLRTRKWPFGPFPADKTIINPIKTGVKAIRKVNQEMSKSRFLLSHSRPHLSTFLTVANIQTNSVTMKTYDKP